MADYNVVIIGSGVAGALCAASLAGTGRKILILEAAKNGIGVIQREQFRRVWDQSPAKSWNTPYLKGTGIRNYPSPGPATPDKSTYFDQPNAGTSLTTYKAYYQRLAGGSTWAWRGNTPRMMPNDFRVKSVYFPKGVSPDGADVADWPLSYNEMKPWYLKAEYELGVSGNEEEWESHTPRDGAKFPMRGQPRSYGDQLLVARMGKKKVVLDGEELPADILTMAQARNTEPYDGRPACEGNHNCIPLCPTNAKYDATVHLKRAVRSGVELRTGCVVTKLEAGPDGAISRVLFKQWDSDNPQNEQAVSGDVVVLAAAPIETAKILLFSGLYPNDHPHVGKHLMDHIQGECLALAPEPIYPFRGPQTVCGIDSIRDGKYRSKFASFRMTLGNDGWGRAGNPTSVVEEFLNPAPGGIFKIGQALRKEAFDKLSRLVRFGISTEQLPHRENRVELSAKKDALGIPRPSINYAVHDYTKDALKEGYRVAKELFAAMGATHQGEPEFNVDDWTSAAHPMGTCRMGSNKTDGVVDKFGRCFNHPNLFVQGASVFPTASATNPALTIAALTLMSVEEIKK
jgi:choline dehydrogenase-like flavoprotein